MKAVAFWGGLRWGSETMVETIFPMSEREALDTHGQTSNISQHFAGNFHVVTRQESPTQLPAE